MFHLASAVPRCSSRYTPGSLCRSPNARRRVIQYVRLQPVRSRSNSLYLDPLCQHLTRRIDWQKLAALGLKGCVLDKDNTLTKPYSMALEPGVQQSLATCSRVFQGNMVLLSNSAGLRGFDRDFSKAATVETALGVPVLRHSSKKPAGSTAELQERFGCEAHEIVCVGDRGLTDIVFGNLNGLLTIQVDPFDTAPESSAVRWARRRESQLLQEAQAAGVQPPPHPLATQEQLRGALGRAMRSH